jgi:hypothetical protein
VRQLYVQELLSKSKSKCGVCINSWAHVDTPHRPESVQLINFHAPPPTPPPHLLLSTEADFNNNSIKNTVSKAGHDYMKTSPPTLLSHLGKIYSLIFHVPFRVNTFSSYSFLFSAFLKFIQKYTVISVIEHCFHLFTTPFFEHFNSVLDKYGIFFSFWRVH